MVVSIKISPLNVLLLISVMMLTAMNKKDALSLIPLTDVTTTINAMNILAILKLVVFLLLSTVMTMMLALKTVVMLKSVVFILLLKIPTQTNVLLSTVTHKLVSITAL